MDAKASSSFLLLRLQRADLELMSQMICLPTLFAADAAPSSRQHAKGNRDLCSVEAWVRALASGKFINNFSSRVVNCVVRVLLVYCV